MTPITRENVERLLDGGMLYIQMAHGRWWAMRRNGATQRWKREPHRIRLPFKCGLRSYGAIETRDFINGVLSSTMFRHRDDVPREHTRAAREVARGNDIISGC